MRSRPRLPVCLPNFCRVKGDAAGHFDRRELGQDFRAGHRAHGLTFRQRRAARFCRRCGRYFLKGAELSGGFRAGNRVHRLLFGLVVHCYSYSTSFGTLFLPPPLPSVKQLVPDAAQSVSHILLNPLHENGGTFPPGFAMAVLPDFPVLLNVPQVGLHFIFNFDPAQPLESVRVGTLPFALHGGCGNSDFGFRNLVQATVF